MNSIKKIDNKLYVKIYHKRELFKLDPFQQKNLDEKYVMSSTI